MRLTLRLAALACATFVAACATAQTGPAAIADGVFVGPTGMTLYTFDRDPMGAGKSACNGPCAAN